MKKDRVLLKHALLGEALFKWEKVTALTTENDARIKLENGDRYTGRLVESKEGCIKVAGADVSTGDIKLSTVESINDPGRDITWKGEALFSYVRTAGNKRSADAAFLFRGVRETEVDSISLKGSYNYGTVEDELSKRSSSGLLKYSYNLSKINYSYLDMGGAMDHFKGLEMRTDTGGGIGWKVLKKKSIEVKMELGLSYSNEDYTEPVAPEPDRDVRYGAGRSAVEGEFKFNKIFSFYQLAEFHTPFDHAGLWRFHSESVISVNISGNLSIKAGYVLEYDRRAAAGTKRTDGKTLVGIGFKF